MAEYSRAQMEGYRSELIDNVITLTLGCEFMKAAIAFSSLYIVSPWKDLTFVILVLSAPIKLLMKPDFEHFGLLVIFCFQNNYTNSREKVKMKNCSDIFNLSFVEVC